MKTTLGIVIAAIVILGGWYLLSQNAPQERGGAVAEQEGDPAMIEGATEPSPGTYAVLGEESKVEWSASKPLITGYTHHGTIPVQSGVIEVGNDTATGSFTIDMTGLKVTSLGGGKAGRESQLEAHLKTGDFFDVEKFPTASFEITSIARTETQGTYTVTGNLTMKGITEAVSFPAEIYEKDAMLHAAADFAIDRTRWGIEFGSSSVFDGLAENAIGDEVTLSLSLVAAKQ